ncbi:hypothetical protein GW17_00053407 [Ensete ventricosum]|nr:hypothetical protein GW17_00053407 [Ensete ventricosum]
MPVGSASVGVAPLWASRGQAPPVAGWPQIGTTPMAWPRASVAPCKLVVGRHCPYGLAAGERCPLRAGYGRSTLLAALVACDRPRRGLAMLATPVKA